jgi:hypothetical protein
LDKKKTAEKPHVKRVYIEFGENDIGKMTREDEKTKYYMLKDNVALDSRWTCMVYEQENIRRAPTGGQYHVERTQFCLVEAESITIHKSQGQTYECVAVNIEDKLKTSLMYVAFSRCTRLENLYLFGRKTIESDTVRGMTYERRRKEVEILETTNDVRKEMNRLRKHKLMLNKLKFLDYSLQLQNLENDDEITIIRNMQEIIDNLSPHQTAEIYLNYMNQQQREFNIHELINEDNVHGIQSKSMPSTRFSAIFCTGYLDFIESSRPPLDRKSVV